MMINISSAGAVDRELVDIGGPKVAQGGPGRAQGAPRTPWEARPTPRIPHASGTPSTHTPPRDGRYPADKKNNHISMITIILIIIII
eukprot:621037-Karenia_brevis.AAC.1